MNNFSFTFKPDVECVSRKVEKVLHEVDDAIGSLKTIKAWAVQHHRRVNTAKTVGTTLGSLGTAGTVIGVVLACFTGGSSLLLSISSFIASVAGGVTSGITTSIDEAKTKEYNQNAVNIFKKMHDSFEDLKEEIALAIAFVDSIKKKLEDSMGKSAADSIVISLFNEGSKIPMKAYKNVKTIKYFKTFELTNRLNKGMIPTRTAALPANGVLSTQANQVINNLFRSKETFKSEIKLIKSNIKNGLVGGAAKGAFVAIGVAVSVWEVVDLVDSWKSDHPSVKVVDNSINDMNSLRKSLVEMKSNLKKECNK